mgnify:CR=1 FL=1
MTEEELVRRCAQNDPLAQKGLFERFNRKMMGVCLRYSNDRDDAEDILQMGFIKVFENIGSFKGSGSLEGWVRRIMVNTALNHYRQNKRSRESVSLDDVDYMLEGSETGPGDNMQAKELLKMVQKLPPGFRAVFNMFAIEGYSHKEIGQILEISEGTSKSQYARARAFLQKLIATENAF